MTERISQFFGIYLVHHSDFSRSKKLTSKLLSLVHIVYSEGVPKLIFLNFLENVIHEVQSSFLSSRSQVEAH